AGVKIPSDIQTIDGRSLLPLLENPTAEWPDRNLFIHQGRWEKGADPNLSKFKNCGVRSQRWRFVNNKELYDIQNDPYEKTNVADEHPEVVAQMRSAFDAWWDETLPLMVNENAPYAEQQPATVRYEKQLQERGIPNWEPTLDERSQ
ncbi:MAG: sulfatase/phosphatase domain-containing protein, partial [Planctomycetota bacterium]